MGRTHFEVSKDICRRLMHRSARPAAAVGIVVMVLCVASCETASPAPTAPPVEERMTPQVIDADVHPAGVRAGGSGNRCAHVGLGEGADLGGARPFPDDDPWNTDISHFPVHPLSDEIKASMGDSVNVGLRAEFGATPYRGARPGIPYVVVPEEQPLVPIKFTTYGGPRGPYPVPPDASIENEGFPPEDYSDGHVIVVQRDASRHNCLGMLYELFRAEPVSRGGASVDLWRAASGAVFNLSAPSQRSPEIWSADAAGLPIFPGLARYEEVARAVAEDGKKGVIPHALRFTVAPGFTRWATVAPATRCAGWGAGKVPFGSRWRLRADWPVPDEWSAQVNVIINTLKRYGMIMADNGGQFFISGAPDERWEDLWLRHLLYISGDNLDMVDTGPITACTP